LSQSAGKCITDTVNLTLNYRNGIWAMLPNYI